MPTIEVHALPKQMDFIRATEREVLYSGAFGAGKSRAACLKVFMRASVPGAVEGLCRKTLVSLKATTLRTLLEPEGNLPPVLPPGSYDHNKSEKTIRIRGGGTIMYFGLDQPEKIGSMNLSGIGVDEAVELTEDDWTMLRGRIRLKVPGLPNQLYGACNPGPPSHWLAQRFGLALDAVEPQPNCRAITTKSTDNYFLPRDYVADLQTFTGLRHKRYVLGQWVGSDGLVYDRWDRTIHVRERHGEWARVVVGVDDGYSKPFACLRIGIDGDGRAHVMAEHYQQKLDREDKDGNPGKLSIIRRMADGAEAIVVDSAAAELISAIHNDGLPAVPCLKGPNSVFQQIVHVVQPRLLDPGDGMPRLTVDASCTSTISEFEAYEWMKNRAGSSTDDRKDEPIKEHDHAMDALRYALTYVDGGAISPIAAVCSVAGPDIDDDERYWR